MWSLVKASNAAGMSALAEKLAAESTMRPQAEEERGDLDSAGPDRMRPILIAVGISLVVSILLTPSLIKVFTRQGFGQEIREDGPPSHKDRCTPSMGGVAIVAGIWAGYFGAHLVGLPLDRLGRRRRVCWCSDWPPPWARWDSSMT